MGGMRSGGVARLSMGRAGPGRLSPVGPFLRQLVMHNVAALALPVRQGERRIERAVDDAVAGRQNGRGGIERDEGLADRFQFARRDEVGLVEDEDRSELRLDAEIFRHAGEVLQERAGVDDGVEPQRFEIVVNLLDMGQRRRTRLRVQVPEADPTVASLFDIYPGTEAMEREAYDMFGILFADHPDLTRILMPEDWEGHPLRKDYEMGRIPVQFKGANA